MAMSDRTSRTQKQIDELQEKLDKSRKVIPTHPREEADREAYEQAIQKKIGELEGNLLARRRRIWPLVDDGPRSRAVLRIPNRTRGRWSRPEIISDCGTPSADTT